MKQQNMERVFLSCASAEFAPERRRLANHLRALIAPRFEVIVQEDLRQGGHTLLELIAECIRGCDLVIHIAGEFCGARPTPSHIAALYQRLHEPLPELAEDYSYTQWEYRLARKFGKRVLVYLAEPEAPRRGLDGAPLTQSDEDARCQQVHVHDIRQSGKHRVWFASANRLLQQALHDISPDGTPPRKASNIDVKSLGPLFKGRDNFLAQIRATLGEVQYRGVLRAAAITATATATTVHGLGGIGKTRAAIEYAHRHADDYTALLLVRADSPENLSENLAELCAPTVLDLPEHQNPDIEVRLASALRWLREHPGWFLILDNVDNEDAAAAAESLLGRLENRGQVLITSRIRNWSAAVSTLQLDVLTVDESAAFLLERTEGLRLKRSDDLKQVTDVAEMLGHLPLALEQAGAHIGHEHLSFEQYLGQWMSNRGKVMQWFDQRLMQYPVSVAVTWLTTVDQLDCSARKLLRTLAWFASDPIPGSVFDDYQALAELAAYSLLTWNDDGGFNIHRLVQEVTRARMGDDERGDAVTEAIARLIQAFNHDTEDPLSWARMKSLSSHGQSLVLVNLGQLSGSTNPDIAGAQSYLGNQLGRFFFLTGRLVQARSMQSHSVDFCQRVLGDEHYDTLTSKAHLALTLQAQGDLPGAHELQEKVLADQRRTLGDEHLETLKSMGNLAMTLGAQGDLPGARKLQEKVLKERYRVLGEGHPDTLAAMNNLAATLQAQGDLSGAHGLQEKVIEQQRRMCGEGHYLTLHAMGELAVTLEAQGDLAGARGLQEKVLAEQRRILGDEHPDTLITMNNLALTLRAQRNLSDARGLQEQALEGLRRRLGDKHPNTLTSMGNLAVTLETEGNLCGARELMEKALAGWRGVLGERHPSTSTAAWNLGHTLFALRDEAAWMKLRHDCLDWLLETSPETLTAGQIKIRKYLSELQMADRPPSRNAPCPCSSGLRYKQCSGKLVRG
jgi:hypothetical protein